MLQPITQWEVLLRHGVVTFVDVVMFDSMAEAHMHTCRMTARVCLTDRRTERHCLVGHAKVSNFVAFLAVFAPCYKYCVIHIFHFNAKQIVA